MSGPQRRPTVRLELWWVFLLAAAVVAAYAVVAVATINGRVPRGPHAWFHPDEERNLLSFVSAATLVGAAASVATAVRRARFPSLALVLAAALVGMAADEWFELHEQLEKAMDRDWSVLYLPVVAVVGVAGLAVVRRTWPSAAAWTLLAGGAAWAVAYALEDLQWNSADQEVRYYTWLMVAEEVLEFGGSTLILLAGLAALRRPARA